MPDYILPHGVNKGRKHAGEVADLDASTIAVLAKKGIFPQLVDSQQTEERGVPVAALAGDEDPHEVIYIVWPKRLRSKEHNAGEVVALTRSERQALAGSLSIELAELPLVTQPFAEREDLVSEDSVSIAEQGAAGGEAEKPPTSGVEASEAVEAGSPVSGAEQGANPGRPQKGGKNAR